VSLALSRIDDAVYSGLRNTLAKLEFDDIVTGERQYLLDITEFARKNLVEFGIEIRDVRIKHTDLPKEKPAGSLREDEVRKTEHRRFDQGGGDRRRLKRSARRQTNRPP
jgi:regulator of protease activity HflC (stomatin/prohibitin superfamily)